MHIHNGFHIEVYSISASFLSNVLLVFSARVKDSHCLQYKNQRLGGKVRLHVMNMELNVLKDRGTSWQVSGSDIRDNEWEFPSPVDLSAGHDEPLTADPRIRWYLYPWEPQEHLCTSCETLTLVSRWWRNPPRSHKAILPLHLSTRLVILEEVGAEKGTAGHIDGIQNQDLGF